VFILQALRNWTASTVGSGSWPTVESSKPRRHLSLTKCRQQENCYRLKRKNLVSQRTAGAALLVAQIEEDVLNALDLAGQYWRNQLGPETMPTLILSVLRDPKFPKKRKQQQITFLADSLAALGSVSPRRSRDICEQERRKEKKAHHIIRHEYYVECSCGYQGPAKDNACRKCGADISAVAIFG